MDGGYAEYVILRAEAAVRIPSAADPAEVAPLLCAGATVFNSMRQVHVVQGSVVAREGIGGLGRLGVRYASKMGHKDFATKLGAHHYVDTNKEDPVQALQNVRGADTIVATALNPQITSPPVGGWPRAASWLCSRLWSLPRASVCGWPSGHAQDSEEAIDFAQTHGVGCKIENFPLENVQDF